MNKTNVDGRYKQPIENNGFALKRYSQQEVKHKIGKN